MRYTSLILFSLALCLCGESILLGQSTFSRTFDHSNEFLYSADAANSNYYVAGKISIKDSGYDALIMKLDSSGKIVWRKSLGDSGFDSVQSIVRSSDGVIVAGTRIPKHSNGNVLVARFNGSGKIIWKRSFGGKGYEQAQSVIHAPEGGYIISGFTDTNSEGLTDALVMKISANGDPAWMKRIGGPCTDFVFSSVAAPGGGYLFAGQTCSDGAGSDDVLVFKLSTSGDLLWAKTYGLGGSERGTSITTAPDGGYYVAGETASAGAGQKDVLIIKLDSQGDLKWANAYGGNGFDYANSAMKVSKGSLVISGYTSSIEPGKAFALMMKVDKSGGIVWKKAFGGGVSDEANAVVSTNDDGLLLAGNTTSFGNQTPSGFITKIDAKGTVPGCTYVRSASFNKTALSLKASDAKLKIANAGFTASSPGISVASPAMKSSQVCQ